jgi:hypothetical protein
MNAEIILDTLCEFLNETTLEMLIASEAEDYEWAAINRDDIDKTIERTKNTLLKNKLTLLDDENVKIQLLILKKEYIKKWQEALNIPGDRAIVNI